MPELLGVARVRAGSLEPGKLLQVGLVLNEHTWTMPCAVGVSSGLIRTCAGVPLCLCMNPIVFVCSKVEPHKCVPAFRRLVRECLCVWLWQCNCVSAMLSSCEVGLRREPEKGRAE